MTTIPIKEACDDFSQDMKALTARRHEFLHEMLVCQQEAYDLAKRLMAEKPPGHQELVRDIAGMSGHIARWAEGLR